MGDQQANSFQDQNIEDRDFQNQQPICQIIDQKSDSIKVAYKHLDDCKIQNQKQQNLPDSNKLNQTLNQIPIDISCHQQVFSAVNSKQIANTNHNNLSGLKQHKHLSTTGMPKTQNNYQQAAQSKFMREPIYQSNNNSGQYQAQFSDKKNKCESTETPQITHSRLLKGYDFDDGSQDYKCAQQISNINSFKQSPRQKKSEDNSEQNLQIIERVQIGIKDFKDFKNLCVTSKSDNQFNNLNNQYGNTIIESSVKDTRSINQKNDSYKKTNILGDKKNKTCYSPSSEYQKQLVQKSITRIANSTPVCNNECLLSATVQVPIQMKEQQLEIFDDNQIKVTDQTIVAQSTTHKINQQSNQHKIGEISPLEDQTIQDSHQLVSDVIQNTQQSIKNQNDQITNQNKIQFIVQQEEQFDQKKAVESQQNNISSSLIKQDENNQLQNEHTCEVPVTKTMINYEADLSDLQLKWKQQGSKDIEAINYELTRYKDNNNSIDQSKVFITMQTEAFKLHKFKDPLSDELEDQINLNLSNFKTQEINIFEKNSQGMNNDISGNQNQQKQEKLFWSAYLPGMVRFLKLKLNSQGPLLAYSLESHEQNSNQQSSLSMNHVSFEEIRTILEQPGNKRQHQKRTLIPMKKQDQLGFKLQRNIDFLIPMPLHANNFFKGHSQISKKILRRKHKGPLYNEAGRLCIDLTSKLNQTNEPIQAANYNIHDDRQSNNKILNYQKQQNKEICEFQRQKYSYKRHDANQRIPLCHSQHQEYYAAFELKPYCQINQHNKNLNDKQSTDYLQKNLKQQTNQIYSPNQYHQQNGQKLQSFYYNVQPKMSTQYQSNFKVGQSDDFEKGNRHEFSMQMQTQQTKYKLNGSFYNQQFGQIRPSLARINGTQNRISKSTRQKHPGQQTANMQIKNKFSRKLNLIEDIEGTPHNKSTNYTTPGGRNSEGPKTPIRLPGLQRSSQSYVVSK